MKTAQEVVKRYMDLLRNNSQSEDSSNEIISLICEKIDSNPISNIKHMRSSKIKSKAHQIITWSCFMILMETHLDKINEQMLAESKGIIVPVTCGFLNQMIIAEGLKHARSMDIDVSKFIGNNAQCWMAALKGAENYLGITIDERALRKAHDEYRKSQKFTKSIIDKVVKANDRS